MKKLYCVKVMEKGDSRKVYFEHFSEAMDFREMIKMQPGTITTLTEYTTENGKRSIKIW